MAPEMPTLRARAANSLAGNSARTSPLAGLISWMVLSFRVGRDAKLRRLAGIVQILVEQLNLRLQARGGRRRHRPAAARQDIAAVLNCNRFRRLTSVHEAHCRYLYRLSVTSHGSTFLLNRYLFSSFRIPFEDHGPTAVGRAVGFLYTLEAIGCYCRSLRISCGCWLAWARTEIPACSNTCAWVKLAVSAAKFAS
jgi:hypothetical protein